MIGDRSGDDTAFGKRPPSRRIESQLNVWAVFTHIRHESIIIISLQKVETCYGSFDNVKGDWADKRELSKEKMFSRGETNG